MFQDNAEEGLESFFPSAIPDSHFEALDALTKKLLALVRAAKQAVQSGGSVGQLKGFVDDLFTSETAARQEVQSKGPTDSSVGAAVAVRASDASFAASSVRAQRSSKSPGYSPASIESSAHSDDTITNAARVSNILIKSRVNIVNGKVSSVTFYANSVQRADTSLPADSQGSHSIAYVEVLLALLNSANEKGVRHAAFDVYRFIDSILQEELREEMESHEGDLEKKGLKDIKKPKLLSHGGRKLVKTIIELCKVLAEDTQASQTIGSLAEFVNEALKEKKVKDISEYLCNIANHFLVEIQKKELTTFYSKGRISVSDSEKAKGAGAEKSSSRALVALEMLCSMCSSDTSSNAKENEFRVKMAKFEKSLKTRSDGETEDEHVARYGLSALFGERERDAGSTADALLARLEGLEGRDLVGKKGVLEGVLSEILSDTSSSSKVAGFMGGLLDYSRQIRFDLSKTTLEDVKKNFLEADGNKTEKETIVAEGTRKAVATVTRTSEDNLAEVLSRSIKIFSAAFPNLSGVLKTTASGASAEEGFRRRFDDVVDVFLKQEIIEKQGWKDHVDPISRNKLTIESLSEKLKHVMRSRKRGRSPSPGTDSPQGRTP